MNLALAVLAGMLFCHILADYVLQGWLAVGKQSLWWKKNAPQERYQNDYKMALFCHALFWAISIFAPIIVWSLATGQSLDWFWLAVPIDLAIHAFVDDAKANKLKITLIEDQALHFWQILLTWAIWFAIWRVR